MLQRILKEVIFMGQEGKPISSAFSKLANLKNSAAGAAAPKPAAPAAPAKSAAPTPAAAPKPAAPAFAAANKPGAPSAPAFAAAPKPAPAPQPAPAPAPAPAPQLKSIDEIAKEVIRGNYGNGEERKKKLAAAGYNYEQVQKRVNEMLRK